MSKIMLFTKTILSPPYKKHVLKYFNPDKYEINKSTRAWIKFYEKKNISNNNNNNKKCQTAQ